DAQLRREHARPFWQVPADVQTVPSHDTSAPPSGNGVAAGHAPEQPPPWHVAQSTRKHPFVSCHVVSVCPPEPMTVARSDHSHGWFSQYRPLDPGTRRKVTEPRQEAGAEESLPESRTAAGLSRLPSAAAKLPSSAAASTTEPPLELEPLPLEPLSTFDASSPPMDDAEEPQCTEKRLTAIRPHRRRSLMRASVAVKRQVTRPRLREAFQ